MFDTKDFRNATYSADFYYPHKKKLFLRILAKLTGGKVLLYQTSTGRLEQTVVYVKNHLPEGVLQSNDDIYFFPDGTTNYCFIERWRVL